MLNNDNYSLEEIKHIINSHKIKSNSLKNYFLLNLNDNNRDDIASQTLGYLGELEYDLQSMENLISNIQMYLQNLIEDLKDSSLKEHKLNTEINILKDGINKANRELNRLKNENSFLKNKDNGNKNLLFEKMRRNSNGDNKTNSFNKTYNDLDRYRNYLNYHSCKNNNITIFDNGNNFLYEPKNGFVYKDYGRLTYSRNNDTNSSNHNNPIINKISYFNKIFNNSENNKIIQKNSNIIDINNRNNTNNIINKINNNTYHNNKMKNISFNNNNNNNNDILSSDYNNKNNYVSMHLFRPIPRQNYSLYKISDNKTDNLNKSFRMKSKSDINRINDIISIITNDEKKLNELKSKFGNNIKDKLLKGDIDNENIEQIEKVLYNMKKYKSIIPMSKRFQIQNRAKSNSSKKTKSLRDHINKKNNNNEKNRFIRQKLSEKKLDVKGSKNKWNTSRDFYNKKNK